jgi:hypothetical protein
MVCRLAIECICLWKSNFAEVAFCPAREPQKNCHFDRRDGAFCRPGVEKSLFSFGIQIASCAALHVHWKATRRFENLGHEP